MALQTARLIRSVMPNVQEERRNDMGQKILIGIILGGFGTIVGLFVNTMMTEATSGKAIALETKAEVRTLQAEVRGQYSTITTMISSQNKDMDEIKSILKRVSPYERKQDGKQEY